MGSWYGVGIIDWEMKKCNLLRLGKKISWYPTTWNYWSNTQKGAILVVSRETLLMGNFFFIEVLGKLAATRSKK